MPRLALASVLALVVTTADARADDATPPPAPAQQADAPPPWAKGVSAEDRKRAGELFGQAVADFGAGRHNAALKAYREALALWNNNPQIHYNTAVALMHLDRPLEAIGHLDKALAWGPQGFEGDLHSQALLQRKLLRGQLGQLTIEVSEPGAAVTVDGAPTDVGTAVLYRAGTHQIVVTKDGFEISTQDVTLVGGASERIAITLERPGDVTVERRFPVWVPWTTVGTGAAFLGVAVVMHVQARNHFEEYDDRLLSECPNGCDEQDISPATRDIEDRAKRERAVATVGYAVGGAVLAAGIALLVLNREQVVETPTAAPVVLGDGFGIAVQARF